jgi:hypothetical protein
MVVSDHGRKMLAEGKLDPGERFLMLYGIVAGDRGVTESEMDYAGEFFSSMDCFPPTEEKIREYYDLIQWGLENEYGTLCLQGIALYLQHENPTASFEEAHEASLQIIMSELEADGCFERVGVGDDGKPIFRRTAKKADPEDNH